MENNDYGSPYNAYDQQYYANLGGVMVDDKGNPLKNRFALKLTLSILMILCCCCTFSPIIMILGIIALVFTCLANGAYNAGNPAEFRSKSRVATVLLAVGGGILALIIAIYVGFFAYFNFVLREELGEELYDQLWTVEFWENIYDEIEEADSENRWEDEAYWEDYWEDYLDDGSINNTEDLSDYNPEIIEETLGDGLTPLAVGFNEFTWNGKAYSIPMDYSQFLGMGIELIDFVETESYSAGEYEPYEFVLDNGYEGVIRVSNNSTEDLSATECEIDYFYIYNPDAYNLIEGASLSEADMTILGGLSLECSYKEVENYLGTSTQVYKEIDPIYGTFETYQWYYTGTKEYQVIQISFYNGKIYEILIDYYEI